jgi:hypothetical protein
MSLDDTPIALTLPAHMWAALRGAARRAARSDRRAADRRADTPLSGQDLDAHRALVLDDAAARIDAALAEART